MAAARQHACAPRAIGAAPSGTLVAPDFKVRHAHSIQALSARIQLEDAALRPRNRAIKPDMNSQKE